MRKNAGWVFLAASAGVLACAAIPGWAEDNGTAYLNDSAADQAAVALGRRLFYEGDLSLDGSMGCSTCHVQRRAFAEGQATHPGVTGEPGRRNAPSLVNVAARTSLTWADPGMRRLEEQARTPLFGEHPVEMGMAGMEAELVRRLEGNNCYKALFLRAYPQEKGAITVDAITRALSAFQRSITSSDTPFDRFMRGDRNALTPAQTSGLRIFERACASCHSGVDLTDDGFHAVDTQPVSSFDKGLAEVTGRQADAGKFRTPSLRHVTLTAPYFHDGSAVDLTAAIKRHRNANLSEAQRNEVIVFLGSVEDSEVLRSAALSFPPARCEV